MRATGHSFQSHIGSVVMDDDCLMAAARYVELFRFAYGRRAALGGSEKAFFPPGEQDVAQRRAAVRPIDRQAHAFQHLIFVRRQRDRNVLDPKWKIDELRDIVRIAHQRAGRLDRRIAKVYRRALTLEDRGLRRRGDFRVRRLEYRQANWLQREIAGAHDVGAADIGHSEHINEREQIDVVARPAFLTRDRRPPVQRHLGAHEQIEAVVDVVRRQPIFALGLGLDVVAIGVRVEAIGALVDIGAATRKQHVVAADRILQDIEQRALARGRRPEKRSFGWMEAMDGAGASAMHELFVVMQIEAIEIDALQALDLFDAQDLTGEQFDRLAGARLHHPFEQDFTFPHRDASGRVAARLAAYSRKASRTRDARSGATPLAIVRLTSSICCWFSSSVTTFPAIPVSPFWLRHCRKACAAPASKTLTGTFANYNIAHNSSKTKLKC